MELCGISFIDLTNHTAYHYEAVQAIKDERATKAFLFFSTAVGELKSGSEQSGAAVSDDAIPIKSGV
ncbi:MAG: hypothetical protein R2795_02695 [Saprospiraceae bacterium]